MKTPKANNDLNALGVFKQRTLYKEEVFPANIAADPIDLWEDKQQYGRRTNQYDAVYPSEAFLKQIDTEEGTFLVLNFVADAFNDFMAFMKNANATGKLTDDSTLTDLKPVKAYSSVNVAYDDYLSVVYDVFSKTFVKNRHNKDKITDFKSFLTIFEYYINTISRTFPLSKSGYVLSKFCDPLVSGIMIELSDSAHDDDETKFTDFIRDKNFIFYSKAAQKFGFFVDKNAPWRLVCNLSSPITAAYMNKYDVTIETLFDKYYYRTYTLDVENLKVYAVQFYNTLVADQGTTKRVKKHKGTTRIERFVRKPISLQQVEEEYSWISWLKLYCKIRSKERTTDYSLDDKRWDLFLDKLENIHRTLGKQAALQYANISLRG